MATVTTVDASSNIIIYVKLLIGREATNSLTLLLMLDFRFSWL
jgi:hypothetical protein